MNTINFLPHFKPLFNNIRYKVLLSGRGSGKSFHAAIALIWYASRCKMKILCLREFMNSIGDSSKAQIEEVIELSGTSDSWIITRTSITHKITGSTFIFKGLRNNYNSLKSIPNIDIAVIEECSGLTVESINALLPTIRKQGSQIWFLGNPKDRNDPVAEMFIEQGSRSDTVIISNDYRDNPFCSSTIITEAENMMVFNPELYNHIYLGEYLDLSKLILVSNVKLGIAPRLTNGKVVVGVDIAREGGDRTVIYVRAGLKELDILSYNSMTLDKLVHELQAVISKYNPEEIIIDSTGMGAWLPEILSKYNIKVKGVNFASKSTQEKKYNNIRTEMYSKASEFFTAGGMTQSADLDKELSASYYTLDNKNRKCIIPKDEIKKKILGKSPDIADAFCLSLLCDGDMIYSTKTTDMIEQRKLSKDLIDMSSW